MYNFQFINREHNNKFSQFRTEEMAEHYRNKKEYLSVVYIMTGNKELYRKIKPYFDAKNGNFASDEMFKEQDFGSGLSVLAKLAVHLFNSNETVEPLDIIVKLDDTSYALALNAFTLRRCGISNAYDLPDEKLYM